MKNVREIVGNIQIVQVCINFYYLFIFLYPYVYFDKFSDCNCNPKGSKDLTCDSITGQCPCKYAHEGQTCNKCTPGNFGEPGNCQCNYLYYIHIEKKPTMIHHFQLVDAKKGVLV